MVTREQAKLIRKNLIEFRKQVAKEQTIPPAYVFTNEELDKILMLMPRSVAELRRERILPDVKVHMHGEGIVNIVREGKKSV